MMNGAPIVDGRMMEEMIARFVGQTQRRYGGMLRLSRRTAARLKVFHIQTVGRGQRRRSRTDTIGFRTATAALFATLLNNGPEIERLHTLQPA